MFLDGSEATQPRPVPEGASQVSVSDSGRYLVYVTGFVINDQIEWLDLETGDHRVLAAEGDFTPQAVSLANPTFRGDENGVVFEVGWSDAVRIAIADLTSGDVQVIDAPGAINRFPVFSPDGDLILVSCEGGEHGGAWALCLIDPEARTRTTLADDEGYDPLLGGVFTPDGQWVVYFTSQSSLEGDGRLYRVGIDGQSKLLLVSGLHQGAHLIAVTEREAVFSCRYPDAPACSWVCVANLDGSNVRRLTYLGEQCVDVNAP
jgi:hypothetical protein